MGKIDSSSWKNFKIIDLFNLSLPKGDIQVKGLEDGEIPLITPSNINNGLIQRIPASSDSTLYPANALTVDMFGNAYYQEEPFFVTAHGHVNVLIPKFPMNRYIGFFIATSIKSMFLQKYGFSDMCTQKVLKVEIIKLPVDSQNKPNWEYMQKYMEQIENIADDSITTFDHVITSEKNKLDTPEWRNFHLYDKELFDIESGTKLDKVKMDTTIDDIAFVGRSNVNNGITAKVKKIDGLEPYSKGYLTLALGGEYLGSCFVQPEDFYTSQNVVVLIPKWNMSFYVKQFIATAIFVESQNNYQAFIKELNAHIKRDFVIKLPVTEMGEPDWNYMESIMRKIDNRVKKTVNNLMCG